MNSDEEESRTPDTATDDADHGRGDVRRVQVGGREFILVGTAHVSRESADLVRQVIEEEQPDHVCVELDQQRYEALSQPARWEKLDLREVIRRRQLTTLIANLLLGSYQKRLGEKLGVLPGTELLEATRAADELGIPFALCDREIRITMRRAWRSMSLWQKWKLIAVLLSGVLGDTELSEDELRELRRSDVLSEMMEELSTAMPTLKRVLIDERDAYLAESMRATPGARVVAVVGAGHVAGIERTLQDNVPRDLESIRQIPTVSPVLKWIGWAIPALIVGALLFIAGTKGVGAARDNLVFWILANGVPAGLGAVVALAHPLTILAALLAAPITSLTPVIGAGYVTAFVQAWVRPPRVADFEKVMDDAGTFRSWWGNRVLRVLLAFIFPTLGSLIGTYLGGARILSNTF